MENIADWLASNKTWKKWITIGVGELLSYAGIDFKKPTDEERLIKEIKKRKNNDMKLYNNRKQATEKRSIEYPNHLKQVENNNKWKEFTNLKPVNQGPI